MKPASSRPRILRRLGCRAQPFKENETLFDGPDLGLDSAILTLRFDLSECTAQEPSADLVAGDLSGSQPVRRTPESLGEGRSQRPDAGSGIQYPPIANRFGKQGPINRAIGAGVMYCPGSGPACWSPSRQCVNAVEGRGFHERHSSHSCRLPPGFARHMASLPSPRSWRSTNSAIARLTIWNRGISCCSAISERTAESPPCRLTVTWTLPCGRAILEYPLRAAIHAAGASQDSQTNAIRCSTQASLQGDRPATCLMKPRPCGPEACAHGAHRKTHRNNASMPLPPIGPRTKWIRC